MRIFHLITHFDLGGAERVAANIAVSETPGMEYHVVEIMRGKSLYTDKFISEMKRAGVVCHRSLMPDVNFHFIFQRIAAILFPLRMLYIMLRWHPDVIHVHTETPDMCIYAFSRIFPCLLRRTRIVRTIHNTRLWSGLPSIASLIEPYYIRHNANIGISDSVCQSYKQRFGADAPIIHNGVSVVEQQTYPRLVRGKLNILFAGRFEPQKGIPVLCDVISALANDQRYHFHIAGDGSMMSMVEERLGGLATTSILKPIFGLSSYMSSFDYLFMPSEFEGLSMLSMEASINRLPVVANRCPGLSDTLPEDWPLLVDNNSVSAYLHLFRDVLPTADRTAFADKAAAFAEQHFSVRKMQEEYEKVYKGMQISYLE